MTRQSCLAKATLALVWLGLLWQNQFSVCHGAEVGTNTVLSSIGTSGTVSFPLVPHHIQRARRGLEENDSLVSREHLPRRRTEAAQVGALYHGYGTHYVDAWVGTPPQRQTVIVDTGSGVTAFPCSGCNDCGYPNYHTDAYFDEKSSKTFRKATCDQCSSRGQCNKQTQECRIGMSYQEGSSWSAFEGIDNCYVGGFHDKAITQDDGGTEDLDPGHASAFAFPLQFGCQTRITGLFKTQLADGIMGMENASSSFWHQMYKAKKIDNKSFSLCYSRPQAASRQGTEAGAMTLGGTERRLHDTPMVFTTVKGAESSTGFFSVHVRAFFMREGKGGEGALAIKDVKKGKARVINLNRAESILNVGGVIVDSGTTDTYWNSKIKAALKDTFKQLTDGQNWGHDKINMSAEVLATLPTILIQLNGDTEMNKQVAKEFGNGDPNQVPGLVGDLDPDHPYDVLLAIPASHYMECENGVCVNRFYATEGSGSVLGANSMMGHDILFDAEHGRIGWAESTCDYNKLVTENGYRDVLDGGDAVDKNSAQKMEKQEEEKEAVDESKTSAQTKENDDDDGVDDDSVDDDEVDDDGMNQEEGTSSNEKKQKPSKGGKEDQHEGEMPTNDIQKSIAEQCPGLVCRGSLAISVLILFGLCFACYRCYFAPKTIPAVAYTEVELSNGFKDKGGPSGYKDEFADEEEDDEDDAEYGVTNPSYEDL
ncbi:xylanase inhibitor [Nitzschia inconspicua]|uniref:Xylanase inhibitor n=1 Tax=Nitzschia inconspicua TaxID=303405 RepID=A0A9K3PD50_9STRA|nr:xylanase inhibitor [Nitzschia inconspicua]